MGLKSNCQHLKSTPIKTLPRYRFGFVIVVSAVLSITRSGKKAWLYLSLCIRWPNESEQELRSNYEQWGKIVIRKKRRWGKWAQRQMLFWTCVRRLVAMCLNTRGACKSQREGEDGGKRTEKEIRRENDVIYSPELVHTCWWSEGVGGGG